MFSGIKTWLVGAGAAVLAALLGISYVFNQGKKQAQADSVLAGRKEQDAFQKSIDSGHTAATGGLYVDATKDPYNRANRGTGED